MRSSKRFNLPCLARVWTVASALLFSAGAVGAASPGQSPGFLTGPAAGDPQEIALNYIRARKPAWGLTDADLSEIVVKNRYVTEHNQVTHIYWRQRLGGIEVYNGDINVNVSRDGRIINVGHHLAPDLRRSFNTATPSLTANEAVASAANHLRLPVPMGLVIEKSIGGPAREVVLSNGGVSTDRIPAKLMYYPTREDGVRLVWNVLLRLKDGQHYWEMNIDAVTGKVLSKFNRIVNDSYRVYAVPLVNPDDGARTLLSNPADALASPFGWLDTNGVSGADFTDTRGNNVSAQEDADNNNTGGFRPSGGGSLAFDFPLDLGQHPTNYQAAAIANLFYWNNVLHDIHYQYGFNEASGNFQENNYGHGGLAGDPVQADAQDGSGTDNANFETPPDGSDPRMQMYIWTAADPDRDSDLDNGIIIHEYGHGVSTRLTGGPANVSCLFGSQSGGMGEGWSDWWSIVLTAKTNDTRTTARPVGTYVENQPLTGPGIRQYPYSTDLGVNPLTYGSIVFTFGEVHAIGEIWCVTLWDLYWNMVDAYGFSTNFYTGTAGNNRAQQLIMDGLKLQPCDPTFLEARDAILQADQIDYGGANQNRIWQAFAKRGMGFSAYDGGDHNSLDVVEAFDLPDDLRVSPTTGFASSGNIGGPFNPASKPYMLVNVNSNALVWTAHKTANWLSLSSTGSTLAAHATNIVTVSLSSNAYALTSGVYTDTVAFSNTVSAVTQNRAVVLRVDIDDYTELFSDNDNDLDYQTITFTPDGSAKFYAACRTAATSFPIDSTGGTVLSLTDDSYELVTLSGGAEVSLYGTSYTSFFVNSNGNITFASGDFIFIESLSNHFDQPRISALFDDLNPATGGTISWKQLSDRVVVTYQNLPQFAFTDSSNFQIEILFNGTIRITYLNLDVADGLAGLSRGLGIPAGFVESDLSAYGACPGSVPFILDGAVDSTNYLQASSGMTLYAAVRGQTLYLATWSPGTNGPNDHYVFVADQLLPTASASAPWAKTGTVAIDDTKPLLGGESQNTFVGWFNVPGAPQPVKAATGAGQMEGTLDLVQTFGSLPATLYLAAAAYSTADGGSLVSQAPAGNGNGNIESNEFLAVPLVALLDNNADGIYDRLDPTLDFVATGVQLGGGGTNTITWASVPGKMYQVQYADSVAGSWQNLPGGQTNATAGQITISFTDSTAGAAMQRFYRVKLLP